MLIKFVKIVQWRRYRKIIFILISLFKLKKSIFYKILIFNFVYEIIEL